MFHKVAQRPGKPIWFGIGPAGQTVFGLPGNPVSALVCLLRYVVPALAAMAGASPHAPRNTCRWAPRSRSSRRWPTSCRCGLEHSPTLGLVAMPRPTRGSGDFISLLGTDGFVELPPGPREFPAGYLAPLYRW